MAEKEDKAGKSAKGPKAEKAEKSDKAPRAEAGGKDGKGGGKQAQPGGKGQQFRQIEMRGAELTFGFPRKKRAKGLRRQFRNCDHLGTFPL